MIAVSEGLLLWARRERDKALNYIEGIERGEARFGRVEPTGAMTDESLKVIVILRRIVADMEELLAEDHGDAV